MSKEEEAEILLVDGHEVRVTHPEKPYFTRETKLSKLDVVKYFLSVSGGALFGISARPIVLKRFVDGAEADPRVLQEFNAMSFQQYIEQYMGKDEV